ncbi:MAG: LysR family transcriptional regulator [Hyphomicrobiales bacterium]|nr:LysR family transcriptional regulator [Hyphomicrobiales bacterium]
MLQTFHLVARTGSFSSASRKLNISYQTAANHVRRLEQMYGAKLVEAEKGSRAISLTPQGKALYASLGKELETILSRINTLMHDVRSVLRVGVPQAFFHHFFPKILTEFRKSAPDIELAFFERDTVLEEMMLEGSLDACVSERFFGEAVITQHLLGEYQLCLIYPVSWVEPEVSQIDISEFATRPFISYEPGQTLRSRAIDFLGAHFGGHPQIATTASGSTSITRLVDAGLGYAIVPEWCVETDDMRIGRVVLNEIQPVKVYFGNTAFLENNEFVLSLNAACNKVLASKLNA